LCACYGQGGERPTLTDANVVLGYLNPESLAGGRVAIQPEQAHKVLEGVAQAIDTDGTTAARGAYQVAVSNMTKAVKAVTSERGRDPRDATMVAFGGAGPLYGAALARELGISTVVVPVHTGLFSSLGLLVADTEYQAVTPYRSEMTSVGVLAEEFMRLSGEVLAQLDEHGDAVQVERILEMRYHGQRFELRVTLTDGPIDDALLAQAYADFHAEHLKTYGRSGNDELVEIVNLRVRGFVPNPISIEQALTLPAENIGEPGTRTCRFDDQVSTPIIRRGHLDDQPRQGPLVIEDMDSTTLVPPDATAHRDHYNNIIIRLTRSEVSA
jgi:N-methylhydantoinase A